MADCELPCLSCHKQREVKMQLIKCFILGFIIFISALNSAQANFLVPFQTIFIAPTQTIFINFFFDQHKIIFCFENNSQTVGLITWPYLGVTQASTLPIFLKQDSNFQGSFADAAGLITITNTTPNTFAVSCLFGF